MNPNIFLKEIQNGNQDSFKRLFYLYYDSLVIYADQFLFDRPSSEDIVQEVFIYFWENASVLNIKISVKGYLYSMVKNRVFNYLKTLKITVDIEILEYTEPKKSFVNDNYPEEKGIRYTKVIKLIETMPEKMKEICNLKYIQSYSYAEISDELGISINTVKTQLKRAKSRLRKQLPYILLFLSLYFF